MSTLRDYINAMTDEQPPRMILRRAILADASMLEDWRTRPNVQAGFGEEEPPDWEEELSINEDWHDPVIAEEGDRPVGYMEIIDPAREATHYWGDVEDNLRAIDIFVANKSDLGKGYGAEMMRLALERCFAPPEVKAVIIDPLVSNKDAIRFYERLGFQHEGARNFGGNACAVMRLTRAAWAPAQTIDPASVSATPGGAGI